MHAKRRVFSPQGLGWKEGLMVEEDTREWITRTNTKNIENHDLKNKV